MGQGAYKLEANISDGFWMGAETFENAPFSVGFDGSIKALNITLGNDSVDTDNIVDGAVVADKIFVDTLAAITTTTGTLNVTSSTSGSNVKIDSSNRRIAWMYDNSERGYMYCGSNGYVILDADTAAVIRANGTGDDVWLEAGDGLYLTGGGSFYAEVRDYIVVATGDFYVGESDNFLVDYDSDNTGGDCKWTNDSQSNTRMTLNQDGDLSIDGNFSAANFDFAELFESIEEFSKEKIPNGTSVVLENGKIRPAIKGENPIGVISATAALKLNQGSSDCGESWGEKYLRNDYGEFIYEEAEWWKAELQQDKEDFENKKLNKKSNKKRIVSGYTDIDKVPDGYKIIKTKKVIRNKLNPKWKKTEKYIKREDRPEWNIVGLIGRVRLTKGQPVSDNWIKLRDISDSVEEWLIR